MKYTLLTTTLLLVLGGTAAAQLSVAVEQSDESIVSPYRGPFFLNDSVIVYVAFGRLYGLRNEPNAKPIHVPTPTQLGQLTQAPDGRLYVIPGGTCDIVPLLDRVYRIDGDRADDLAVEVIIRFGEDYGPASSGNDNLAVAPDGTIWITTSGKVITANPATGIVRTMELPIRVDHVADKRLVAIDSTRAVVVENGTARHLQRFNTSISSRTIARDVRDMALAPGGKQIYALTSEGRSSFGADGGPGTVPLPFPVARAQTATFASPDLVLLQTSGGSRLLTWRPSTNDTTSAAYYPDVTGWGLRSARVSGMGDLATRANDQDLGAFTTDFPAPESQSFIQVVARGADPTLMGPPLDFSVAFRNALNPQRETVLAFNIEVANVGEKLISEATIAGSGPFGVSCREFYNVGVVSDLPPRARTMANIPNRFYYVSLGSHPAPNTLIESTFKVMHSNNRPVADAGRSKRVSHLVSSLHDIAPAPDVTLYPTLAATTVTVEYAAPRQSLLVLDALGRVAFRQNLDAGQTRATVDVTGFGESLYYLLLSSNDATSVHPFTVQR